MIHKQNENFNKEIETIKRNSRNSGAKQHNYLTEKKINRELQQQT